MNVATLIVKEIVHRKLNFLLSLMGVVTAVALFVAFSTTGEASLRETTRLMRDMGFNLRLIPRQTDMATFWAQGYSSHTMPEEYIQRFATNDNIVFTHLLATLHRNVAWQGKAVILTGLATREVFPKGKEKGSYMPTTYAVEPGTVLIGHEVGGADGPKGGDTMTLEGAEFTVKKRLARSGSADDIRVYMDLGDAQALLGMEGEINEIKALECLCRDPTKNTIDILTEEVERMLPEAVVVRIDRIAAAREKTRLTSERYVAFIIPFVIVVAAAWIGTLAAINVRDRQAEIGVMRALGHGSGRIAALFLGKAAIVGLVGAVVGYFAGTAVSLTYGPEIFRVTASKIEAIPRLLYTSLAAAPAFAALSSFIPAMMAVTHDPADTLREE